VDKNRCQEPFRGAWREASSTDLKKYSPVPNYCLSELQT